MINYLNINHDKNLICVGRNDGFCIICLENNQILMKRNTKKIYIIEIFYNTNIIFIVGDNKPLNILNIWDDSKEKYIGFIKINNKINFLKTNKKYIVLSDNQYIYIYNFNNLQFKQKLKYTYNNFFHYDLSSTNLLLYTNEFGYINILNLDNNLKKKLKAHDNNIQYIKISNHSKYIASVSENGSIIKIFDCNTLNLIKLLYRGISHAEIITIDFDIHDNHVLVYSNLNTVHIFSLNLNNLFIKNLTYFFNKNIFDYETSLYKLNLDNSNVLCIIKEYNQLYVINREDLKLDKYILNNDSYRLLTTW